MTREEKRAFGDIIMDYLLATYGKGDSILTFDDFSKDIMDQRFASYLKELFDINFDKDMDYDRHDKGDL